MEQILISLILAFISGVCFMCNFISGLADDKSLRISAIVLSLIFFGMSFISAVMV